MTLRERINSVLSGVPADLTPFTIYSGLAPQGEVPDMGYVRSATCYQATAPNVEITSRAIDDTFTEYTMRTPIGELTSVTRVDSGYGSTWRVEHFVKRPEDYAILEYAIKDTEYSPVPGAAEEAIAQVGDRGVAFAWIPRAPFQRLWIEWAGVERVAFDLADCPDVVEHTLAVMLEEARRVWPLVAVSPVELIWVPDNVTGEIASPSLFERFFLPYYDALAAVMHPAGKKLCCHMDGLLKSLKGLIAQTPIDVMEAFNPPPDGDMSVAEALEAWPEKRVWINFPSSMHLASDERITALTREMIAQAAPGDRFLIGITENIPAAVGTRSLQAISAGLRDG